MDGSCTGSKLRVPDNSRLCRLVRGRRYRADPYCMGGRRRAPSRSKTHRRYGRRRGNKGYLKKQLEKERQQRKYDVALALVRGGMDPAPAYGRGKRRGQVTQRHREYNHAYYLGQEAEIKHKIKTLEEWNDADLKSWLENTREKREQAKEVFVQEQRELREREEEEAAQRDAQSDPDGILQACGICDGVGDCSDQGDLIPCDASGCSNARHTGCCDPPLQELPVGNVSTCKIVAHYRWRV